MISASVDELRSAVGVLAVPPPPSVVSYLTFFDLFHDIFISSANFFLVSAHTVEIENKT